MSTPKKPVTVGERLKALRKRIGKNQAEMAGLLHLSTTGYQRYERDERDLPAVTVERARQHIGLNPRWIFDGVGEMFLSLAPGPEADRIRRSLGLSTDDTDADREHRARQRVSALVEVYPDLASNVVIQSVLREAAGVEGLSRDTLHSLAANYIGMTNRIAELEAKVADLTKQIGRLTKPG